MARRFGSDRETVQTHDAIADASAAHEHHGGLLENDRAADFLFDVVEASLQERLALLDRAMARVGRDGGDLEVPAAEEAGAAALVVAWAAGRMPAEEEHRDLAAALAPVGGSMVEAASGVVARMLDPQGNQWWQVWREAGEDAEAIAELTRPQDALTAVG